MFGVPLLEECLSNIVIGFFLTFQLITYLFLGLLLFDYLRFVDFGSKSRRYCSYRIWTRDERKLLGFFGHGTFECSSIYLYNNDLEVDLDYNRRLNIYYRIYVIIGRFIVRFTLVVVLFFRFRGFLDFFQELFPQSRITLENKREREEINK